MSAPSQSVCVRSDKIARWCILGVQGALLHQFLEEGLHISSLTAACTSLPAKQHATQALSALKRAILGEPIPGLIARRTMQLIGILLAFTCVDMIVCPTRYGFFGATCSP